MSAVSPFGHSFVSAVPIRSPGDMAQLLRSSCPDRAHAFALAAHETACSGHNEERTAFWLEVAELLRPDGIQMKRAS